MGESSGDSSYFYGAGKGKDDPTSRFLHKPGERVLIVEDIVTTGGSVQEVVDVVKAAGGEIVGVGLLVDRSGGKAEFGVPKEDVQALLNFGSPTYEPETCPLCKEGVPMTERGSHTLKIEGKTS